MASLCNFSPTALGDAEDLCQHLLAPGQNHKHKQTNQTKKKRWKFSLAGESLCSLHHYEGKLSSAPALPSQTDLPAKLVTFSACPLLEAWCFLAHGATRRVTLDPSTLPSSWCGLQIAPFSLHSFFKKDVTTVQSWLDSLRSPYSPQSSRTKTPTIKKM